MIRQRQRNRITFFPDVLLVILYRKDIEHIIITVFGSFGGRYFIERFDSDPYCPRYRE